MAEREDQLKRIQEKVQQLLKKHTALQKENQQLRTQLEASQTQAIQHLKNVETLKQQVEILKASSGQMSEADKKQFEKRINSYLKEIDRCIAMLGD